MKPCTTGGCGAEDCEGCARDVVDRVASAEECFGPFGPGAARVTEIAGGESCPQFAGVLKAAEVARRMKGGAQTITPNHIIGCRCDMCRGVIGSLPLQADDDMRAPRIQPCPDARYPDLWRLLMDVRKRAAQDIEDGTMMAWAQATQGKGAERHGTERPYTEQPTYLISQMCGPSGPFFQSVKKGIEAERLNDLRGWQAAKSEIIGHVVYALLGLIEGDRRMGE